MFNLKINILRGFFVIIIYMKTKPLYLEDPYLKKNTATITRVKKISNSRYEISFDSTIFYPEGGGQPSDKGIVKNSSYEGRMTNVQLIKTDIVHFVTCESEVIPKVGDKIDQEINWDLRYHNMKVHSYGHLIDFAISKIYTNKNIKPVKGEHGKNPFLIYGIENGIVLDLDKINKEIENIISSKLNISWKFVSYEELESANWLPDKLPRNKPLREVTLEGYGSVADGGTLVKNTKELNEKIVIEMEDFQGMKKIKYNLIQEESSKSLDGTDYETKINNIISDFKSDIQSANTNDEIENLKIKYIGKKSDLIALLRGIKDISKEKRQRIGQLANETRASIENEINIAKKRLQDKQEISEMNKTIDVTLPGNKVKIGTIHPITQMKWKTEEIFQKMGFEIVTPYEIDNDYNTFTALNMPESHPARGLWDTFWTEEGHIPITHTSAMQNRILRNKEIPIRAIVPGKCFRNEATDATHEIQFYQVEGVYVDKGITFADMIGTLQEFMRNFFEKDVEMAASVFSNEDSDKIETRIQPSFFPFVEPAIEIMIKWKIGDSYKWLEVIPCGPIHPNVLKEGGLDPEVYTGFAWGFGLERLIMIKYGIEDLRNFHGGDLRFLRQFI